jgi:hypothetical protein
VPKINDRSELQRWLADKPREWAVVLAARAALRAVPFIASVSRPRLAATTVLPVLRATGIARFAAAYPNRANEVAAATSAAVEARVTSALGRNAYTSDAAAAASAAASAAAASESTDHDEAAQAAAEAAAEAADAAAADGAAADGAAVWEAVGRDAERLERGTRATELVSLPLWAGMKNRWFDEQLDVLRLALNRLGGDWPIWQLWYDSIFEGRPSFGLPADRAAEIDERVFLSSDEWWSRPPAEINSEIAAWVQAVRASGQAHLAPAPTVAGFIVSFLSRRRSPVTNAEIEEAYRRARGMAASKTIRGELSRLASAGRIVRVEVGVYAAAAAPDTQQIEPQSSVGLRFLTSDDGRIDIDADDLANLLRHDRDAKDRHAETRRMAQRMLAAYDPSALGGNTAKDAAEEVGLFLEALGNRPRSARPGLLLPRGDALRQLKAAQDGRDPDSDLPPLPDAMKLALGQLVSAYNNYVGLDPELARQDEARLGPDAVAILISPSEGIAAVRSAVELGAATPQVERAVAEEAKVAPPTPDPSNRLSRRFSEGSKNFIRAMLGRVRAGALWIGRHRTATAASISATGMTFVGAAKWVLAHEAWVEGIFANNAAMLGVVEHLIAWLKTLPLS